MGRTLSKEELLSHKDAALNKLDKYITSLAESSDRKTQGKSDKLSYWIEDWTTFLNFESTFSPSSLRRYKRGEIIKAHLGYNVGSEEGGLHYCVVIDKNNSKNSPVVTIIPLTSVKRTTDLDNLHRGNIYLGNETFTNLSSKISFTEKNLSAKLDKLEKAMTILNKDTPDSELDSISNDISACRRDIDLIKRMKKEVQKMKIGSIAIVPQIRTISKIRIYDPKTNYDILSNVKLSNEKLDLIDTEIIAHFTGKK